MEGLTTSELAMIKKLAGNDAQIRKKTMKKLKIWLTAIVSKVPNSPDCRSLIENNFLRVWKALFYCMWQADKPLPQEQLAEQISDLVTIFASKPIVFHLFVEWFIRTMAREWPFIDRLRMDKFMMLIRRFLRKTLTVIDTQKWKLDILDGFLRIITTNIFNRHPEVKSTRSKAKDPAVEVAPVGMQLHFVDVFLEELSKVGGQDLKSPKILKILSPFIQELSVNDDDRVMKDIEERIFFHLMRQSDVGIDYAEGVLGMEDDDDEDDDDDDGGEGANGGTNGMEDQDAEDAEEESVLHEGRLDPRAGAADVVLPQLSVDYSELAKKLVEIGGQKTVRMKNRKLMYKLANKFKEVTSGSYPLALDMEVPAEPAIRRKDVEKAAKRLVKFEEETLASSDAPGKSRRKPKKMRLKLAKQSQLEQLELDDNNSIASDNNGSESESSFYLRDDELLDHVGDNYMSYLEELHQKEGQANGMKSNGTDEVSGDEEQEEANFDKSFTALDIEDLPEDDEEPQEETPKKKRRKSSENPPKPLSANNNASPPNKKKRKTSAGPTVETLNESPVNNSNEEDTTPPPPEVVTTPTRSSKKKYVTLVEVEGEETPEEETYVTLGGSSSKGKKRKLGGANKNSILQTPGTPASAKRKRVSFVLARNLQHEHSDYAKSITRSPAIPFDSEKQPGGGLLKSPAPSPSPSSYYFKNSLPSTPRRKTVLF